MASTPHEATRRLIRRYLDPRRPWGAEADRALRAHLRECEACAGVYDKAVAAHRLVTGGEIEVPSGFEQRRMRDAMIAGVMRADAPPTPRRGWPALAAAGLAGAALLAVMLAPPLDAPQGSPEGSEHLGARGAEPDPGPLVGIGLSGVTPDGSEYEVVQSDGVQLDHWVRVYWSNERPDLRYLFVVGIQEGRDAAWYAPLPPDEVESVDIGTGRSRSLTWETRLASRHAPGPLRVVALFTAEPLSVETVDAALDPTLGSLASSELKAEVTERLPLDPGDVVQVLETRVLPGAGEEAPHAGP